MRKHHIARSRHGRRLPVVLAITMLATAGAHAQEKAPEAACGVETIGTGKVRRVLDGRTIQLEVGQLVYLAAIEVPSLPLPREAGPQAKAGPAAKSALEAILAGKTITLKKLGPDTDRYGRILAHVFIDGQQNSVQQEMLARGYARVGSDIGAPLCAAALFAAEITARTRSVGLWSDPYYVIQRAEEPVKVLGA